jgi:DNA-directed RNA polymerase subunit beta
MEEDVAESAKDLGLELHLDDAREEDDLIEEYEDEEDEDEEEEDYHNVFLDDELELNEEDPDEEAG